jgi:hypothetical protein
MIHSEQINPKQLQAIVGHASIQLTCDTYGHLMPDSFDGFGDGLDACLVEPAPLWPRMWPRSQKRLLSPLYRQRKSPPERASLE